MSGISRVVIGSPDPVPEFASEGAAALHSAGLDVEMGVEGKETAGLIEEYAALTNVSSKKLFRALK
jgi:pyrimidine deaminase RibD-like protein